ncbi:hypothetical protein F4779DRAFT_617389 [Xylariaceae sp. FL0662B]|nr:hypothetical protein F4779DRAFT_617389 [Xylariaceae sp. FL0662B]
MLRTGVKSGLFQSAKNVSSSGSPLLIHRLAGSQAESPSQPAQPEDSSKRDTATTEETPTKEKGKKTMKELDEEIRLKMSGIAGDGGEAGVEYENGEPVAMKRSVKNNMFRYI